jgi:hypothetical protein
MARKPRISAVREVDGTLTTWAMAFAAARSPDPTEFLTLLEAMLMPLLREEGAAEVLQGRVDAARGLLRARRTDPRLHTRE